MSRMQAFPVSTSREPNNSAASEYGDWAGIVSGSQERFQPDYPRHRRESLARCACAPPHTCAPPHARRTIARSRYFRHPPARHTP